MNCRRFQNRLYEYLDGTLSRWTRGAADRHLARCAWCRAALRQEQQLAQVLSQELEKNNEPLALGTEALIRVRQKLSARGDGQLLSGKLFLSWGRLTGAIAIATS